MTRRLLISGSKVLILVHSPDSEGISPFLPTRKKSGSLLVINGNSENQRQRV